MSSFALGRIVAREAGGALQLLDHRMQRAGRVVGRALVEQAQCAARRASRSRSSRTRRDLPIPGSPESSTTWPSPSLACRQRRSSSASSSSRPTSGVSAGGLTRLEAAFGPALARDPPRRQRLGEALEALRAEVVELEQAAEQATRGRADHHRSRLGQRLQARREVGRLADHRLLARCALADQIADHRPGRWRCRSGPAAAHPHGRRSRAIASTSAQPRAHRPLGIVLVRLRPAEVGQHAIAQVLGDVAVEAADDLGARRADRPASPRAGPRGRAAPPARSSRPGRRTAPSAAGARLPEPAGPAGLASPWAPVPEASRLILFAGIGWPSGASISGQGRCRNP